MVVNINGAVMVWIMKMLFVTAFLLAMASSVLAQGEISCGISDYDGFVTVLTPTIVNVSPTTPEQIQFILANSGPSSLVGQTSLETIQSVLEQASGVVMLEQNRNQSAYGETVGVPIMPPTPSVGLSAGTVSDLSIQSVPEPPTFALGGLAFSLMAILCKQKRKLF